MPRRLAVPAIAVALAFLDGGVARAQDRTDFFVDRLKTSPVFVSDSITRRVDAADRATLLRQVEDMPFPTFLIVAPSLAEDYVGGDDQLALIRDGLGEDGLYILSDDRGTGIDLVAFGVEPRMRARDIANAVFWDYDRKEPALDKLEYVLALARGEPRRPRSERAEIPPSEGGPEPTPYVSARDREADNVRLGFAIMGVFAFGAVLSPVLLERRRRRRLRRGRRLAGSLPAPDVRERAVKMHRRLAADIGRRPTPPGRALDLEAAASMALDRRGRPIDDLGALVLAERGREALRDNERERCYFDPRHPGWAAPTRWTTGRATVDVPACKRCARAIGAGEVPDSVWDGDRPYWQRETVWARTGFGALQRDLRRALAEDRR